MNGTRLRMMWVASTMMLGLFIAGIAEAQLPGGFKKDHEFNLGFVRGKVLRVLGPNEMIVGLEKSNPDKYDGKGPSFSTLAVIKCDTKDFADGDLIGDWRKEIGSERLKVTGTKTYKTTSGGIRTFWVLEPVVGK